MFKRPFRLGDRGARAEGRDEEASGVKILVCMKQVPSSEARIVVAGDGKAIDPTDVEMIVNPYDEYALEEALRIK